MEDANSDASDDIVVLHDNSMIEVINHSSSGLNSTNRFSAEIFSPCTVSTNDYLIDVESATGFSNSIPPTEETANELPYVNSMSSDDGMKEVSSIAPKKKKRKLTQEERNEKKLAKERDAALKKSRMNALRILKPANCLRAITVVIDNAFISASNVGPEITARLSEAEIQYELRDLPISCSILWNRRTVENPDEIIPKMVDIEEPFVLQYIPYSKFKEHASSPDIEKSASSFVDSLKTLHNRHSIFVVVGPQSTKQSLSLGITYFIHYVKVFYNVDVALETSNKKISDVVFQRTKAIAERPHKLIRQQNLLSTDAVLMPVKSLSDGTGSITVWKHMLMQFTNVSEPMADTTCRMLTSSRICLLHARSSAHYLISPKPEFPEAVSRPKNRIPKPRSEYMKPDQDWPSVWPTSRSFNATVIPLPIRQGYPAKHSVPPWKHANAELIKIPNFFHLTPPAVERHCKAIQKFTTKWPEELHSNEMCKIHFPVEITTSDYCFSGPSIRHPEARVVTLKVHITSLPFPDLRSKRKLKKLVGDRLNDDTGFLTLVCDRCPTRKQNTDYALYLLTVLFHESCAFEEWEESEKLEEDEEEFVWKKNAVRENVYKLFQKIKQCTSQTDDQSFLKTISDELNVDFNIEDIDNINVVEEYREALKTLVDAPKPTQQLNEDFKSASLKLFFNKKVCLSS